MGPNDERPVLAVVAGDDANSLVEYAAAEAVLRRCPLHLLRAVDSDSPHLAELIRRDEEASILLHQLAANAERLLAGRETVTTERVRASSPAEAVIVWSGRAQLVVTQHRDESRWHEALFGSLSKHVGDVSRTPVAVVPYFWYAEARPSKTVVVGVDELSGSFPLVRAGARAAQLRGASLSIIHAGHFLDTERRQHWQATAAQALGWLRGEFPGLDYELQAVRDSPASALGEASRQADLLVVGRTRPERRGEHLGQVALATLTEASCPVLIVEPAE
jgi:nucleotide-binding universal stress UspA family protein